MDYRYYGSHGRIIIMKITGKKYAVGTEFTDVCVREGIERKRYFKITGYNRKGQMKVVNYAMSYSYEKDGATVFEYGDCNKAYLLNPWFGDMWTCFPEVLLNPENIVDDTID